MRHRGSWSPWAVTSLYAVSALAAGALLPRIEQRLFPDLTSAVSVPAATALYASVASGMIALTGIVFSMTFVMVQFSATAYSPRLVLWFARDPLLAHAFGTFTATFLYAIAALAWVDRAGAAAPVPRLSALVVVALLLASVGMFVGLINRITLLQISRTLGFTGDQGRAVIEAIYPDLAPPDVVVPDPAPAARLPERATPAAGAVRQIVMHHGPPLAVQGVDVTALVALAAASDAVIEMLVSVGETVVDSTRVMRVVGARRPIDERLLRKAVVLGAERTFEQDPKYALRLLADIAIRALSPAVNDPTTAVQALDQIGDLLLRLSRRRLEIGAFRDRAGRLRAIVPFPTWDDFLQLGFGEICAYGATSVQVMRRMHALVSDLIAVAPPVRRPSLAHWQAHLRRSVATHFGDADERESASTEDRQGLGVSRRALGA